MSDETGGRKMQDSTAALVYEYRLSWEMLVPGDSEWRHTERLAKSNDPFCDIEDQHATLRQWAETGAEPIRNVLLERRVVDDRWEAVDAASSLYRTPVLSPERERCTTEGTS